MQATTEYITSNLSFETRCNLLEFRYNFIPAVVTIVTSFALWEFLGCIQFTFVAFPPCYAGVTDAFTRLSVALELR